MNMKEQENVGKSVIIIRTFWFYFKVKFLKKLILLSFDKVKKTNCKCA